MARRNALTKHPALAAKAHREEVKALDREFLAGIPGWETLNPDQKRFIMALPYYSTRAEAARAIGRTEDWYDQNQRRSPAFKSAIERRLEFGIEIARAFWADMLHKGFLRLDEMLERGAEKGATQLDVVKLLVKLNGLDAGDEGKPQGKTFISAGQIVINTNGQKRQLPQPVVEAQVADPDQ